MTSRVRQNLPIPRIPEEVWDHFGLHPHLWPEWNRGKWSGVELRKLHDGTWAVVASSGAVVLGVFPDEEKACIAAAALCI